MDLKQRSKQFRLRTLEEITKTQSGCAGSCLSCIDIMTYVYFGALYGEGVLKQNPDSATESDYFILSKISAKEAFKQILRETPATKLKLTLPEEGWGLSIATGLAKAYKDQQKTNKVFCLIEDSEVVNGNTCEAATVAGRENLDNLILLVDNNQVPGDNKLSPEPLADKLRAFGFKTLIVVNGHNFEEIEEKMAKAFELKDQPIAIIFRTIKGKGVSFIENKASYYYNPISEQELTAAKNELQ